MFFIKRIKLESIYLFFNTINVSDMSEMFCECNTLKQINISHFKITKNTNIKNMFGNCSNKLKNKIKSQNLRI